MKRALLLVPVFLALATLTYGQFKFTSIDCPGAKETRTYGINNHGDIDILRRQFLLTRQ